MARKSENLAQGRPTATYRRAKPFLQFRMTATHMSKMEGEADWIRQNDVICKHDILIVIR